MSLVEGVAIVCTLNGVHVECAISRSTSVFNVACSYVLIGCTTSKEGGGGGGEEREERVVLCYTCLTLEKRVVFLK